MDCFLNSGEQAPWHQRHTRSSRWLITDARSIVENPNWGDLLGICEALRTEVDKQRQDQEASNRRSEGGSR